MTKRLEFTSTKTKKLAPQRKQYISERNKALIANRPELAEVEAKLLALGGEVVVLALIFSNDSDLEEILNRSEVKSGKRSKLIEVNPWLSEEEFIPFPEDQALGFITYYARHKGVVSIMEGFVLSRDGLWRPSRWFIDKETNRIIETTERSVLYYGFALTEEEAAMYCLGHLWSQVQPRSQDLAA